MNGRAQNSVDFSLSRLLGGNGENLPRAIEEEFACVVERVTEEEDGEELWLELDSRLCGEEMQSLEKAIKEGEEDLPSNEDDQWRLVEELVEDYYGPILCFIHEYCDKFIGYWRGESKEGLEGIILWLTGTPKQRQKMLDAALDAKFLAEQLILVILVDPESRQFVELDDLLERLEGKPSDVKEETQAQVLLEGEW